jgi:hypothetical protein
MNFFLTQSFYLKFCVKNTLINIFSITIKNKLSEIKKNHKNNNIIIHFKYFFKFFIKT